ncbi:N-acetyltransferase [Rhodospirillaceae bacterium KN72]|uniref:N-acetyltransferase n=1 Tax=Pacificispira spongiicola TaxID=2729598 RepID=A0A7Y0HFZ0_9PROT|nr:GNAT family N-acetyltransferase [Pacificispira spongiicola]NMM45113.1 N-acetyltransferase [Pacificispira spongiicola]
MTASTDSDRLPPNGFAYRDPQEDDAAAILDLGRTLLLETDHYLRLPEERAGSVGDARALIRYFRDLPGAVMLHVWDEKEARPVAEGVLTRGGLQRISHVGTIGIGVLKSYWGRGLGQALMATLEDTARCNGIERLDFTVLAGNRRARDFYRRLGYREEGRRRRSVRFVAADGLSARYEDEIAMAKWIGPEDGSGIVGQGRAKG